MYPNINPWWSSMTKNIAETVWIYLAWNLHSTSFLLLLPRLCSFFYHPIYSIVLNEYFFTYNGPGSWISQNSPFLIFDMSCQFSISRSCFQSYLSSFSFLLNFVSPVIRCLFPISIFLSGNVTSFPSLAFLRIHIKWKPIWRVKIQLHKDQ